MKISRLTEVATHLRRPEKRNKEKKKSNLYPWMPKKTKRKKNMLRVHVRYLRGAPAGSVSTEEPFSPEKLYTSYLAQNGVFRVNGKRLT